MQHPASGGRGGARAGERHRVLQALVQAGVDDGTAKAGRTDVLNSGPAGVARIDVRVAEQAARTQRRRRAGSGVLGHRGARVARAGRAQEWRVVASPDRDGEGACGRGGCGAGVGGAQRVAQHQGLTCAQVVEGPAAGVEAPADARARARVGGVGRLPTQAQHRQGLGRRGQHHAGRPLDVDAGHHDRYGVGGVGVDHRQRAAGGQAGMALVECGRVAVALARRQGRRVVLGGDDDLHRCAARRAAIAVIQRPGQRARGHGIVGAVVQAQLAQHLLDVRALGCGREVDDQVPAVATGQAADGAPAFAGADLDAAPLQSHRAACAVGGLGQADAILPGHQAADVQAAAAEVVAVRIEHRQRAIQQQAARIQGVLAEGPPGGQHQCGWIVGRHHLDRGARGGTGGRARDGTGLVEPGIGQCRDDLASAGGGTVAVVHVAQLAQPGLEGGRTRSASLTRQDGQRRARAVVQQPELAGIDAGVGGQRQRHRAGQQPLGVAVAQTLDAQAQRAVQRVVGVRQRGLRRHGHWRVGRTGCLGPAQRGAAARAGRVQVQRRGIVRRHEGDDALQHGRSASGRPARAAAGLDVVAVVHRHRVLARELAAAPAWVVAGVRELQCRQQRVDLGQRRVGVQIQHQRCGAGAAAGYHARRQRDADLQHVPGPAIAEPDSQAAGTEHQG